MDYSSNNPEVWSAVVTFCIISVAVLICNMLYRKIPAIRRSMLPVAVLAGFILLLVKELGWVSLDVDTLSVICYHSVAIGFIAMSLRVPKESERTRGILGFRTGAVAVGTYMLQIIVGMGIAFILAATVMPDFFTSSGLLVAYGFGQGPGQANNIGATFEPLGFAGGRSFGLSLAAAGYLIAFLIGVLYMRRVRRRRNLERNGEEQVERISVDMFQDECEAPASDSIDRLSVQISMVLAVYLLAYLFISLLVWIIGLISPSAAESISGTLWGFNFLAGVLMAVFVRAFIRTLRNKGIMTKQHQNNYLLTRISGCAFDFMIASGIAAIELGDLSGLWLPFLLMAVAGGLATFAFLLVITRHVYKDYPDEAFVSMFGTWTGTIGSGMILLREIDPDFTTPASNNILIGSSYAIILGIPLLLITSGAPANPYLWYLITIGYFLLMLLIVLARFQRRKPKGASESESDASDGAGEANGAS